MKSLEEALERAPASRIPDATYRFQFNEQFTLTDARERVRYLRRLGVSDLYASPYFRATSPHGYDITEHGKVNPSLGGEEALREIVAELQRLDMGHVLDVVPNHMGVGTDENEWWNDVLENGPASPYATYFDIEWEPLKASMTGQVLLPILGDQYGRVLEKGELSLRFQDGAFVLDYWERTLPVSPCTYHLPLEVALDTLQEELDEETPALLELRSILTAISHLPGHHEDDPTRLVERHREKEVIKRRLATLMEENPEASEAIHGAIDIFNGTPGDPSSFDRLDVLLAGQAYRLAFWRVAAEEINYRRFFDINELAAIRMELPDVFDRTHRLILTLIGEGSVTGLRIDHPDGLWDPAAYFRTLQREATVARARRALEEGHDPLTEEEQRILAAVARRLEHVIAPSRPLYLVAEKIVEHGEAMPTEWPVHGTTGYEYLNVVGGLWVDPASEARLSEIYTRTTGERESFDDVLYQAKKHILRTALASELSVLAHRLNRLAEQNRRYRDFTLGTLTVALREVLSTFPIYRTYISDSTEQVSAHDRKAILKALHLARRRSPELDPTLWEFIRGVLLLELPDTSHEEWEEYRTFAMRFQQLSGPAMAKGLEDTAFYRFNRLVSLNEVGGDPRVFGITPEAYHQHNKMQRREWPHRMLSSSTHDTKRSEDVRARIAVISEMPDEWEAAVERWQRMNGSKARGVEGKRYPSRNDEYLLYQTLLGTWPLKTLDRAEHEEYTARIVAYMQKATNEAKAYTSWRNPDTDYDEALEQFVRSALEDQAFLDDFLLVQQEVALYGAINSLSQVTLKYAAPGVPDLYQGNEVWDFSLVDPDNRRPVDFDLLEQRLASLLKRAEKGNMEALARELVAAWQDGSVKMWVTHRALAHRRARPYLYCDGTYEPLRARGDAGAHLVAFARTCGGESIIAVVPRLMRRWIGPGAPGDLLVGAQRGVWQDTVLVLPAGRYRNILTGETITSDGEVALEAIFAAFPVALLAKLEA